MIIFLRNEGTDHYELLALVLKEASCIIKALVNVVVDRF